MDIDPDTARRVMALEQRRRDFMAAESLLYDYMFNIIAAKVYDSAGDTVSGIRDGRAAANLLWSYSGRHRDAATRMRRKAAGLED